jgi:hypothetical protein
LSIGIDLFKQAVEFASRTAPKLESGPNGADPFSHIDITLPLFTRETAVTDTYREQPRLSPYRPQRQLYTPPISKPAGMLMYSTFLPEPKLIGFAYDLEQRVQVRRLSQFLDSVTPVPNADLCDQHPEAGRVFPETAKMPAHNRIF